MIFHEIYLQSETLIHHKLSFLYFLHMQNLAGSFVKMTCSTFWQNRCLPHLWILAVLWANGAHVVSQGLITAAVSGHKEEGVAQQTVLRSGQQLLVSEGIRVATPDIHNGVPVAVREGKNSLKRSADTHKKSNYRFCCYHHPGISGVCATCYLPINTVSSQV